jgi:hypothetical protein
MYFSKINVPNHICQSDAVLGKNITYIFLLRNGRLTFWDFIYDTQPLYLPPLRRLWGMPGSNPELLHCWIFLLSKKLSNNRTSGKYITFEKSGTKDDWRLANWAIPHPRCWATTFKVCLFLGLNVLRVLCKCDPIFETALIH